MMNFHRLVSTALGIGYIGKGAGSISALVCCFFWWWFARKGHDGIWEVTITLVIVILGVWSAGKVEMLWGKDHQRVVIDEVAGMCISLLWVPVQIKYLLTAFILFRFFDIVKPLFIKRVEGFSGGWGVMSDDVLAGIYTNLILQLIVIANFFS